MDHEIVIIVGSFAGLAAALQLVRARRRVLLIDGDRPRNRMAEAVHGIPGQDGHAPTAVNAALVAGVQCYPGLDRIDGVVASAEATDGCFGLTLETGDTIAAPRLILAHGVSDDLPDVPGLAERGGRSVHHCPYCHGYEVSGQRLAGIGFNHASLVQALVLPDWRGEVTLFPDDRVDLSDDDRSALKARGVAMEDDAVAAIEGRGDSVEAVRLVDGRSIPADSVFTLSATRPNGDLVEQLGCATVDADFGPYLETNFWNQTSVAGVYAADYIARPFQNVTLAMADGVNAAVGTHHTMVLED